jgi:hypothetical protein
MAFAARFVALLLLVALICSAHGQGGPSGVATDGPTTAPADTRVEPHLHSILIQRYRQFGPDGRSGPAEGGMKVRLKLYTAPGAQAIEYFDLKLDQGTDGSGRDLVLSRRGGFFGSERVMVSQVDRDAGAFEVELPGMKCPAPTAKRLLRLSGSVKLRQATDVRAVKFIGPTSQRGRTLTHPQLAGVRVGLGKDEPANQLTVALTGLADKVVGVRLATPLGKSIPPASIRSNRSSRAQTWTLAFDEAIAPDAILVLDVADHVVEVEAKFKFENVELP